jgi:hypothetical protein
MNRCVTVRDDVIEVAFLVVAADLEQVNKILVTAGKSVQTP